jgi:L-ascorbate metabolism protein UlaG (beta-lactamase superfamily)
MKHEDFPAYGHDIGEHFAIGPVNVEVTPADHAWQNASPGASDRIFEPEDACGFWIETPDGTIWAPGDSRLIPDHHLRMPTADAMLFDFSDSEWHFGLDGAIEMANAYPRTPLLLYHWGCVDAPDFPPFNADPDSLQDRVENPERIQLLAPGQPYVLRRLTN